jgi:hypothetical protein
MRADAVQLSAMPLEADLQQYLDSVVEAKGLPCYRVPDTFWKWVYKAAPVGVRCWLFKTFGQWPDSTVLLPVDEGSGIYLAVCIELKRKGSYIRKGQRVDGWQWIVCKGVAQIDGALGYAEQMAERCRAAVRQ